MNSDNTQEVIIRTNGGTLAVNAPSDTVRHYGSSAIVNVEAISQNTFEEYAQTTIINVSATSGNIIVKNGGTVYNMNVLNEGVNISLEIGGDIGLVKTINNDQLHIEGFNGVMINRPEEAPSVNEDYFEGTGTELDPYVIYSWSVLKTKFNDETDNIYIKLGRDIIAEETTNGTIQTGILNTSIYNRYLNGCGFKISINKTGSGDKNLFFIGGGKLELTNIELDGTKTLKHCINVMSGAESNASELQLENVIIHDFIASGINLNGYTSSGNNITTSENPHIMYAKNLCIYNVGWSSINTTYGYSKVTIDGGNIANGTGTNECAIKSENDKLNTGDSIGIEIVILSGYIQSIKYPIGKTDNGHTWTPSYSFIGGIVDNVIISE